MDYHYEVGNKFPKKYLSEAPALAYGRRYHLAVFRVTDTPDPDSNGYVRTRQRIDICAQCQCSPCCCANKQEDSNGEAAPSV